MESTNYVFDKKDIEMLISSFDTEADWGIIKLANENIENQKNLEGISNYLSSSYVLSNAHYEIHHSDFTIDVSDFEGPSKDFNEPAYQEAILERDKHIQSSQEELEKSRRRIHLLNIDETVLEGLYMDHVAFNDLVNEIKILTKHQDNAPELWEKFQEVITGQSKDEMIMTNKNTQSRGNGISL